MMHHPSTRPKSSQADSVVACGPVLGRLLGWLIRPKAEQRPEPVLANTRTWEWIHSDEQRSRPVEARIEDFRPWLFEQGYHELTRRQLTSLFWEFVEVTETRPMTWGRFDKSLRDAGIQRFRLGGGDRSYRYRVTPAAPKLVMGAPRGSPDIRELRRAA